MAVAVVIVASTMPAPSTAPPPAAPSHTAASTGAAPALSTGLGMDFFSTPFPKTDGTPSGLATHAAQSLMTPSNINKAVGAATAAGTKAAEKAASTAGNAASSFFADLM